MMGLGGREQGLFIGTMPKEPLGVDRLTEPKDRYIFEAKNADLFRTVCNAEINKRIIATHATGIPIMRGTIVIESTFSPIVPQTNSEC
jgi:hypothetical protein